MGKIELKLTRFKKFLFFRIAKKEKVGFHFINRAMLIASENLNIDIDDFFDWADKNRTLYFAELMYSAYLTWCQDNYKEPVFNKQSLLFSFGLLEESDKKKIFETWSRSESFGVKKSKKKVKR